MTLSLVRAAVLTALADAVTGVRLSHPTRVGIEGRSAAGKTTFADELAETVRARGREAVRATLDDFHRPGHKFRSQRDGWTPQSYYDDGYDYQAFREFVLQPLGPGGSRRCRTALFDSFHDGWLPEEWRDVGDTAIAICDGVFLLRPELADHWDYLIWLDIDMELMVERARRRDVAWVGSERRVVERYRRHWIPTHELYERLTAAPDRADAVVDNHDPAAPRILRLTRHGG
ncbi:MAG TPA: uridine kinase [Dehalococcoidia bacterium]|nr:uridine kinase [Dehalococcoidia bacterium]